MVAHAADAAVVGVYAWLWFDHVGGWVARTLVLGLGAMMPFFTKHRWRGAFAPWVWGIMSVSVFVCSTCALLLLLPPPTALTDSA
jgi:hypothetical protein